MVKTVQTAIAAERAGRRRARLANFANLPSRAAMASPRKNRWRSSASAAAPDVAEARFLTQALQTNCFQVAWHCRVEP